MELGSVSSGEAHPPAKQTIRQQRVRVSHRLYRMTSFRSRLSCSDAEPARDCQSAEHLGMGHRCPPCVCCVGQAAVSQTSLTASIHPTYALSCQATCLTASPGEGIDLRKCFPSLGGSEAESEGILLTLVDESPELPEKWLAQFLLALGHSSQDHSNPGDFLLPYRGTNVDLTTVGKVQYVALQLIQVMPTPNDRHKRPKPLKLFDFQTTEICAWPVLDTNWLKLVGVAAPHTRITARYWNVRRGVWTNERLMTLEVFGVEVR